MNRRFRKWGLLAGLPALHLAVSFGVFAYVFQSSFWVGAYRGIPLADHLLVVLWWPIMAVEPLLPVNFITRPYAIVILVVNSMVWVYVAAMMIFLFNRYRARRVARSASR